MSLEHEESGARDVLPLYGVQLADVYLYELGVTRRVRTDSDPIEPTLDVSIQGQTLDESGTSLQLILRATIEFPFRDSEALANIACSAFGQFLSEARLEEGRAVQFAQREGLALMYPYLRSMVGVVTRLMALPAAPLPVLDVQQLVQLTTASASSLRATDAPPNSKKPGPSKQAGRPPQRRKSPRAAGK
jgi:preprotein translocase subunit SecB